MNSGLLKLDLRDFLKGALVCVVASLLPTIQGALSGGGLNWNLILNVAVGSFVGYLAKQLATDENNKLLGRFQV